ncbi:MAG: tetratricopeptide repeat protein [Prevotella sp.]|nr:tetratricopeptide repeat protein [Prevotella sp.]
MQHNEELNQVIKLTLQRRLGRALSELENYLLTHPQQMDMDVLMGIKEDYTLMDEYWQRGFADPHRDDVYNQLLRRTFVLATNMVIHWELRNSTYLHAVYSRPRNIRKDWSMNAVRKDMEAFVSDQAMLSLEPENMRQQHSQQLYYDHQQLQHDLFDYILTSRQWKDSLAQAFEDILVSPTIDTIDQQLIVSAITLSVMQHFDYNKFRILVNVYSKATDPQLRQRALVGWVLSADDTALPLYPEMKQLIAAMCEDETARQELTELQMQLFYCMGAEADTRRIQQEIMPDLINGSNLRITRQGLVEMDEDKLEDILHPEAAEQGMEKMEKRMEQMMDMQKQGADIYFGGFSQMKRFPFFSDTSNWFVPFYPQHPAISTIWQQERGRKFLHIITKIGAFCDSDKYSFVLAFNQVLERIPASMLKLIEDGEASPIPIGGQIGEEELRQPAFIRRMYLQDLYRFYRLYPARVEFVNPFDAGKERYLFFASDLFQDTPLSQNFIEIASFLMKRKLFAQAFTILSRCGTEQQDYQYHMLMGTILGHMPENTLMSALECYRKALLLQPDSQRALVGFARASFRQQHYDTALEAYQKLLQLQPDNKSYMLNTAVCMMNAGQNDEALKLLYKLNYLDENDNNVNRVLAWALTLGHKYQQAGKLYDRLLSAQSPQPSDLLNYGYCLWFAGEVTIAISMFRQFQNIQHDKNFSFVNEFLINEHSQLQAQGKTDTEIQLMLDKLQA